MVNTNSRRLGRIGILAVLASAACNSLVGFEDDYRFDGANAQDGGGDSSDAMIDNDARVPPDTQPTLLPCAGGDPTVVWCDDFDQDRSESNLGWTELVDLGGTFAREPDGGKSGGGGLHVLATKQDDLVLRKTIPGGFADKTKLKLSFYLRIPTFGSDFTIQYTIMGAIRIEGHDYGIATYSASGCQPAGSDRCVDESSPGYPNPPHTFAQMKDVSAGGWHSVEITVERTGSSYTGRVSFDGADLDINGSTPFDTATASPKVEIAVGSIESLTSSSWQAKYYLDDVVVRRE